MSLMLRGLRKSFDGITQALDDLSLEAADGAFLAVLGPSGSGKTTLLRVIAGLDAPDQGQIVVDGQDMACVPARLRGAGMVFQHYALFRHMSVADNIAFGLRVRPRATRPSRLAIRARVQELLDLVQMPALGARYPDQLSGGQRQRVALARALAIEPRLLLLDEPFGALDARVRRDLRRWLRDLHDRLRLTTILVTHDQTEALELADQVAVLRAGRLEQIDTPARLYDQPATAFVHEFLGDTVRLPCVVRAGQAVFAPAVAAAPIPTRCPEGPASALIRPHQIRLLPAAAGMPSAPLIALRLAAGIHHGEVDLGGFHADVILPSGETGLTVGSRWRLDLRAAQVYASSDVIKP